ncbi:MAG TPA: hypothetical protein VF932_08155 [Anaerolineae bacterium]
MIVLYLGPNTVLPLASILAAVVGLLLIAPRYFIGLIRKGFRRAMQAVRREAPPAESENAARDADPRH